MELLGIILSIVSIILGLILWYFSPKSLRRLTGFFSNLLRRHPAEAVKLDIDLFDGRVEILSDELLSHPADVTRKKHYYEMVAPLGWDIIAANADIKRDQQSDVIAELTKPVNSLRFVCIHGEAGSGKSTLAWRVAAQLHTHCRKLVIRIRSNEEPEVWYRMTEFCKRALQPVCVLVDDLFRNPEVCHALRELDPWLNLVVLATSQTHEYHPGRLRGQVVPIHLEPPSLEERTRVLHRLGLNIEDLNAAQLTRFNTANEFLVLMVELTSGKGFQEVIWESLDNLRMRYQPVYLAYEYLCFSYCYGVETPASLLERLDSEGRFHDLPNREEAQGLVFYVEERPDLLRTGHRRRAEMARRHFERRRSSTNVLREIVSAVNASTPLERMFLARLLRIVASKMATTLEEVLPHIEQTVDQCVLKADRISEMVNWRAFYVSLDNSDAADQCVEAALALEPFSSSDCNMLLCLYRESGREHEALSVLAHWSQRYPELGGARPAYLGLVERHGSEVDRRAAIDETGTWLATHSDDNYVRTAFLGLVERHGTSAQIERVLDETDAWLATHSDNSSVRTAFLGLVERHGTSAQIERVLKEIPGWLRAHPNAIDVWERFLSYLISFERVDDARALAKEAVIHHATNMNLVTHYLAVMKDHLDQASIRELYGFLLNEYPDATTIRAEWARWLITANCRDEAENVFKALIEEHPKDFSARYSYGRLLLDLERYDEAAEQFRQVLDIHRGHAMAHDGLALVYQALASRAERIPDDPEAERLFTEAELAFKRAIHWAGIADNRQAPFFTHLGWCNIDRERWADARSAFSRAMNEAPEYFGNYLGKGRALVGLEEWREATRALKMAREKAPNNIIPPAFQNLYHQLIRQCEAALTTQSEEGHANTPE